MYFMLRDWATRTFGVAAGGMFLVVYLGFSILFVVSGSFAIDEWFGTPDWLSIVIMMVLCFIFPPAALVLAIAGIFYWP